MRNIRRLKVMPKFIKQLIYREALSAILVSEVVSKYVCLLVVVALHDLEKLQSRKIARFVLIY